VSSHDYTNPPKFSLPRVSSRVTEDLTYSEDTMSKVYWALMVSGLNPDQIDDAINGMQAAGILFRERANV
jgi:tRNA(His) 5'-end guanylyltransferase